MSSARDTDWTLKPNTITGNYSSEQAQLAVLMDVRAELRRLRSVLECSNTAMIPRYLRRIASSTAKPKKARRK